MSQYEEMDYQIFKLFKEQWALVAAGQPGDCNACTVSWGNLGTLWTRPGKSGQSVTVYLHPARYTQEFFARNELFTVSFFPERCKQALGYMGSHSGREGDKAAAAGLTVQPFGGSVTYEEAELSFLCRKVYAHQFAKEDMAEDVRQYYIDHPQAYPLDENGIWQPHWVYVGEILDVIDRRQEGIK